MQKCNTKKPKNFLEKMGSYINLMKNSLKLKFVIQKSPLFLTKSPVPYGKWAETESPQTQYSCGFQQFVIQKSPKTHFFLYKIVRKKLIYKNFLANIFGFLTKSVIQKLFGYLKGENYG